MPQNALVVWDQPPGEIDSIAMVVHNTFYPVGVGSIFRFQGCHRSAEHRIRSSLHEPHRTSGKGKIEMDKRDRVIIYLVMQQELSCIILAI